MNPKFSSTVLLMLGIVFAQMFFTVAVSAAEIKFRYGVPGHVFTSQQNIEFSLTGKSEGICTIYTYDSRKVFEKEVVLPEKISIPNLPNGYYFVEYTSSDKKTTGKSDFAVVSDPSKNKVSYEVPFSMDVAFSTWKKIDEWHEIVRLLGIKFVRERLQQTQTEPQPGKYNWDSYGNSLRKLSGNGIHVSASWHQFAPWARKRADLMFPEDILTAYHFTKKAAEQFKNEIQVWEAWNEPELLGFNKEAPWEYASMMKAAYLGFKAGAPDHPVTNGSYCLDPAANEFAYAAFRNDLADYADIFNFHNYKLLSKYSELIQGWKMILKENGIGDQMLWITENATRCDGLAAIKPEKGNFWRQSPEQEMVLAEFITKSQILLQNLGVSRTFFFIIRPVNEQDGRKEWGIMRRDNSVKPGYAAFATMLSELGNAECLGEVDLGKAMRGFLYRLPDGSRTLAFWSISELDTAASEKAVPFKDLKKESFVIPGKTAEVIDTFGTPYKIEAKDGRIEIPSVRLTSYLRNAPAMEIKKAPEKAGELGPRKRKLDRSVVLRILPSKDFKLAVTNLSMHISSQAKDKTIVLQAANFSEKEKKAVITVEGCWLPGFPANVTLKPLSVTEIKTTVQDLPAGKYTLIFRGSSNDLPISQLEFPFRLTSGDSQDSAPIAGADDPKKWRENSSGKMNVTFDEPEQCLRFEADFNAKENPDFWVYPYFDCPNGLKGNALSFEIKVNMEGKKPFSYFVILNNKDGKNRFIRYSPKNHKWTSIFVELDAPGFEPNNIKSFQIGMNPRNQEHVTWHLRNVRTILK